MSANYAKSDIATVGSESHSVMGDEIDAPMSGVVSSMGPPLGRLGDKGEAMSDTGRDSDAASDVDSVSAQPDATPQRLESGRTSPGGTFYKGRGVRKYQGRYMKLPMKRFDSSAPIDPSSNHGPLGSSWR